MRPRAREFRLWFGSTPALYPRCCGVVSADVGTANTSHGFSPRLGRIRSIVDTSAMPRKRGHRGQSKGGWRSPYLPTPDEIREWCAYFQSTWSKAEEAERRPSTLRPWQVPGLERSELLVGDIDE